MKELLDEDILIKYHEDIEPLSIIDKGDWIDVRASEDVFIPHNQMKLVSLGFSMQLPKGYEAHLVPRSSTFKKWGVIQTNGIGIIDNSYNGNDDIWMIPFYCLDPKNKDDTGKSGTLIKKNDRIGQFRIIEKQPTFNLIKVDNLENENRGGFGSTGKN